MTPSSSFGCSSCSLHSARELHCQPDIILAGPSFDIWQHPWPTPTSCCHPNGAAPLRFALVHFFFMEPILLAGCTRGLCSGSRFVKHFYEHSSQPQPRPNSSCPWCIQEDSGEGCALWSLPPEAAAGLTVAQGDSGVARVRRGQGHRIRPCALERSACAPWYCLGQAQLPQAPQHRYALNLNPSALSQESTGRYASGFTTVSMSGDSKAEVLCICTFFRLYLVMVSSSLNGAAELLHALCLILTPPQKH